MVNGIIIVILVGYAYLLKMPGSEIVPLVLTAILASIPVACLPLLHLRRRWAQRPWQSPTFFPRASPRWTKRPASRSCAPIKQVADAKTNWLVGVARANRLPSFSLTADAGTMTVIFGHMSDKGGFWDTAAGLTQPVSTAEH
jgi:hypothetical protein